MRLDVATLKDIDAIIAFYEDVTERTPEMATYARWSIGKHPTAEGIRVYINEGSMYLYRESGADPYYFPFLNSLGVMPFMRWNYFCNCLQDNDTWNRFSGKYVKLGANIGTSSNPITTMAGSSYHVAQPTR